MFYRAKYPLAMIYKLLTNMKGVLGMGYDIGCSFEATVRDSPIPSDLKHRFKSLVGIFHGHAHNWLCQLIKLGYYVDRLGLEDLEGCKHCFSGLNHLSSVVHHSSIFHRRQAISEYARHTDSFETYQSLSRLLCDNYHDALNILSDAPALVSAMEGLGVKATSEFADWLAAEKKYLKGLTREPLEETLQMEYVTKLEELKIAA